MKKTGMVRRLDALGRLCIPMELRRTLQIGTNDSVEYFLDGDKLIIKKFDVAGDLEQILKTTEKSIKLQEQLLPRTTSALLAKIEQMKKILANHEEEEAYE